MSEAAVVEMQRTQNKVKAVSKSDNELAQVILEEGANVPLDANQAFLLPAWYDERKFTRGQRFFHYNFFSIFVSNLCGLVLILVVPSILRILVMTGQSSTQLSAFQRYLDTMCHMLEWYDGDLRNPNSRASKSLMNVRARHSHAARKAKQVANSNISQRDLALTQFGFMGFALIRQKELGIQGSQNDFEGFIHFWRVIGYFMGIKEKFNLCQGDVETTRKACEALVDQFFTVALSKPPAEFNHMSKMMLEGCWAINPAINTEVTMVYTKILCNMEYSIPTSLYNRTILNLKIYLHAVLLNSVLGYILRPILNFNTWLGVYLAQRIPYLAFIAYGRNVSSPEQYSIRSPVVVKH